MNGENAYITFCLVKFLNSMEGHGEYTFPSGTRYVGNMKDGM